MSRSKCTWKSTASTRASCMFWATVSASSIAKTTRRPSTTATIGAGPYSQCPFSLYTIFFRATNSKSTMKTPCWGSCSTMRRRLENSTHPRLLRGLSTSCAIRSDTTSCACARFSRPSGDLSCSEAVLCLLSIWRWKWHFVSKLKMPAASRCRTSCKRLTILWSPSQMKRKTYLMFKGSSMIKSK